MKALFLIDSFKGSLSSMEASEAAARGLMRAIPEAEYKIFPLADGGEGTVDAIIYARGGRIKRIEVTGPAKQSVEARYGITPDGTAVIEMAEAAGITLLSEGEKNPLYTTTLGVGELIRDAIVCEGCRDFIIGIGGSATNDGGIGMLSSLGVKFTDKDGRFIAPSAIGLRDLEKIDLSGIMSELSECRFRVACDVKNPLCGELGCSAVYGPQKGADEKTVAEMDGYLKKYATLTKEIIPHSDADAPGTGAAGGLGFAFLSYLSAELVSGIELVIEAAGLDEPCRWADVVITGEGRLDGQSAMGKAPIGVARLAKKYDKQTIAIAGSLKDDAARCNDEGIDAFFSIIPAPVSLSEAINKENAKKNMENTSEQIFRLMKSARGID